MHSSSTLRRERQNRQSCVSVDNAVVLMVEEGEEQW